MAELRDIHLNKGVEIGDQSTDNNWRIKTSGAGDNHSSLLIERRESGVWVEKFSSDDVSITEYDTSLTYNAGDIVTFNSSLHICDDTTTGAFNPSDWIDLKTGQAGTGITDVTISPYTSGAAYVLNEPVVFNNTLYTANQNIVSAPASFNATDWSVAAQNVIPDYSGGRYYAQHQSVMYDDILYRANNIISLSNPVFQPSEWTAIGDVTGGAGNEIEAVTIPDYTGGVFYFQDQPVIFQGSIYKALADIPVSGGSFDPSQWDQLGEITAIGDYEVGKNYSENHPIFRDRKIYRSQTEITSAPASFNMLEWDLLSSISAIVMEYTQGLNYSKDELIISNGELYTANSDIVSSNPTFQPSEWTAVSETVTLITDYSGGQNYLEDQPVVRSGVLYKANADIIGSNPTFQPSEWTAISADAGGQVDSVVGGTNVTVDVTDPVNPIVNLNASIIGTSVNGVTLISGGSPTRFLNESGIYSIPSSGGQVDSIIGGTNVSVDATDPVNPIVNLDSTITGTSVNGVTLNASGSATNFLNETGSYSVPPDTNTNIFTTDGSVDGVNRELTMNNGASIAFDGYNTTAANFFNQGVVTFSNNLISMILNTGNGSGGIVGTNSFIMNPSETVFTDGLTGIGIKYAGDYSANFVARSLVDKAYVDNSIPTNLFNSVNSGTNITVNNTDPLNPIVNLNASITGTTVNGVSLTTGGASSRYLDETGNYSVPSGGGGGGTVTSVNSGTNITVDNTDADNPIVNLNSALTSTSVNGVSLTTGGAATSYLDATGNYSVPAGGGGGGQVDSVVGGTNVSVDATDPVNPIVNLDSAITGTSVNGVSLTTGGSATAFLNGAGNYTTPAAGGQVDSVVGGTNVTVDATDPVNPIVNLDSAITSTSVNGVSLTTGGAATAFLNATGSYTTPATGGQVDSVVGGTNITIDATDPANPIANLDSALTSTSVNGVSLTTGGAATSYLDATGNYSVPAGTATSLSIGTVTSTTFGITSDGGADDVVLPSANATDAGLLSAAAQTIAGRKTFADDRLIIDSPNATGNLEFGWFDDLTPSDPNAYGIRRSDASGYFTLMPNANNPQLVLGLPTGTGTGYIDVTNNRPLNLNTLDTGTGTPSQVNIGSGGLQLDGSTLVTSTLDEDDMVSDSATALATQQSIKAYVDESSTTPIIQFTKNGTQTIGTASAAIIGMNTPSIIDAADFSLNTTTGEVTLIKGGRYEVNVKVETSQSNTANRTATLSLYDDTPTLLKSTTEYVSRASLDGSISMVGYIFLANANDVVNFEIFSNGNGLTIKDNDTTFTIKRIK